MNQQKRSGRGCLFWGPIISGLLLLVVCLALFLGYQYARHMVEQFTDAKPMELPAIHMSTEELTRLRNRISDFSRAVDQNKPVEPLVVTADEINALIATDPEGTQFKNHVYIMLEGGQVKAQMSIPADRFGFKPLRGRYLNAAGTLGVSFTNGVLRVSAEELSVKGKPLPENFMRPIRAENFAREFNNDPKARVAMDKLEDIQVTQGKVVITPKKNQ
jgi:hypothetical protein